MKFRKSDFNSILTKLNIKKGDTVLVNSNILKIIINTDRKINASALIHILKKKGYKKRYINFSNLQLGFL